MIGAFLHDALRGHAPPESSNVADAACFFANDQKKLFPPVRLGLCLNAASSNSSQFRTQHFMRRHKLVRFMKLMWLSMRTRNAGVVSSSPAHVAIKTPSVGEEGKGKPPHKFHFHRKTQSHVSGICYAQKQMCDAAFLYLYQVTKLG